MPIPKEKYWLVMIAALSIATNVSGIRWGLPSEELNTLYFSGARDAIERRIKEIEKIPPEDIYKGLGVYEAQHPELEREKLPRYLYNPIRSYHPDEYYVIKSLAAMDPGKFDFNPHQYAEGGGYLYLVGGLIFICSKFHMLQLSRDIGFYFFHPEEMTGLYVCGRAVTLLYSAGIIILLCLFARRFLALRRGAFLGGILLVFTPLLLLNSHYMYTDVSGAFWVFLCIFLQAVFMLSPVPGRIFLVGVASGIACGTKATLLLSLAIPFVGTLLYARDWRTIVKGWGFSGLGFISALVVTNPYFFLTFPDPLADLSIHSGFVFAPQYYLQSLRYGLGMPLFIFSAAGILLSWLAVRNSEPGRNKIIFLLTFWILFYGLLMACFAKKFARYILPIVPVAVLLGVYGWESMLTDSRRFGRIAYRAISGGVLCLTMIIGFSYLSLFLAENVRTTAGKWIQQNIGPGSSVGVTEVPWQFQMPPFDYDRYKMIVCGYDTVKLKQAAPRYLILSSFQAPVPTWPLKLQEDRVKFWNDLTKLNEYTVVKEFRKIPEFLGWEFRYSTLPEDLIYLNPTILVLEKK